MVLENLHTGLTLLHGILLRTGSKELQNGGPK